MPLEEISQAKITAPFVRFGALILGVLFLLLIVSRLVYPYSVGSWEAFNWMPTTHLLEGKNPFSFTLTSPYSVPPYGIFYYVLLGIGVKLFGFQLWFGRFLTAAAFGFCLYAVARITGKAVSNKTAVWFAVLAGLAMFPSQVWVAMMRSDIIAAAFGLAALWLVFEIEENAKIKLRRIFALIFFAAAAFFTKQPFILPAAFVFLRLLQLEKWREAAFFAVGLSTLTAAVMFFLDYTSAGGYFWLQFVHSKDLPFSFANSVSVFVEMLKHPTFSASIIFLLIFAVWKRDVLRQIDREKVGKILRSPKVLLFVYAIVSGAAAFVSAGRTGGNANYYIENSFAAAIVCGLIFDEFSRRSAKKLATAFMLVMTFGGLFQFVRVFRGEYFRWQSLSYYREVFDTAAKNIQPGDTCVSVYPELVVWNGCAFNFDDFEEYQADWSPEFNAIFRREISNGRYAVIVWYRNDLQEMFPNYRLLPMTQSEPEKYPAVYLYVREK